MTLRNFLENYESYISYGAMNFGPSNIGRLQPKTTHYNRKAPKDIKDTEDTYRLPIKKKKKKVIKEMTTSAAVGSNLIPASFLGRIMRRFTDKQSRDDILGLLRMVKGVKK